MFVYGMYFYIFFFLSFFPPHPLLLLPIVI